MYTFIFKKANILTVQVQKAQNIIITQSTAENLFVIERQKISWFSQTNVRRSWSSNPLGFCRKLYSEQNIHVFSVLFKHCTTCFFTLYRLMSLNRGTWIFAMFFAGFLPFLGRAGAAFKFGFRHHLKKTRSDRLRLAGKVYLMFSKYCSVKLLWYRKYF